MASNAVVSDAPPLSSGFARKWLGWLAVVILAVWGGRFLLQAWTNYVHYDAAHYHHYWVYRWWLIGHIGGGTLALLLGPPQFSTYLRRRWLRAHRWTGRMYLLAVLVGAFSGADMGLFHTPFRAFGDALVFLAAAWFFTSLIAYVSVRRRQIAAHREWMIRSYVVTFAFVIFRGLEEIGVFGGLGAGVQAAMNAWVCWVVPLCMTEIVLQWRRSMGAPARSR